MNNKILTLGLYDYNETRLVKTDRLDIANDNANILVKKLNDLGEEELDYYNETVKSLFDIKDEV